ncbi:histidine kinase [bacterium]|nr:histidine kinase [bacterium]
MNLNRVIPFNQVSHSSETFISSTKLKIPENKRLRNQLRRLLVFHKAIRILHNQSVPIPDSMQQLISILPGAFQYPEICAAHIQIGDFNFVSKDFANTPWMLNVRFDLANKKHGIVNIIYRKKKAFLAQERELIDSFGELLCFALDRRNAQEALREKENALRSSDEYIRDLSDRLIHAQEMERSRIARNLHDNVNQQVAALAISLSSIKKRLDVPGSEILQEFTSLQERIFEIAKEIRNVSHELHPGILERLGLTEAIRNRCTEFSSLHGIRVEMNPSGDADHLPRNVALCVCSASYKKRFTTLHPILRQLL